MQSESYVWKKGLFTLSESERGIYTLLFTSHQEEVISYGKSLKTHFQSEFTLAFDRSE